jgi:hypothetical protein
MTYQPGIPRDVDIISDSQADLQTNFGQLNTVFDADHATFNATSNRGKHKKVTFLSLGNDPDTDAPATLENEIALFALEDGSDTEVYSRAETNGTVNKLTQNGELYIYVHPVFAINMDNALTVFSSYNYDSGTGVTRNGGGTTCDFTFPFTNAVLTPSGNPTNNYMWSASAFDNSSNPVIANVPNTSNYNTVVTSTSIRIQCKNQNGTILTSMTRLVVVCWKVQ